MTNMYICSNLMLIMMTVIIMMTMVIMFVFMLFKHRYILQYMSKEKKAAILVIFSLIAFYVYQFVIGFLVLLLAAHTYYKD